MTTRVDFYDGPPPAINIGFDWDVPDGLEGVFLMGGTLDECLRNRVAGKPPATLVGVAPVIGPNYAILGGNSRLQSPVADFGAMQIKVVCRNEAALADGKPVYFVSTLAGPSQVAAGQSNGVSIWYDTLNGDNRLFVSNYNLVGGTHSGGGVIIGDNEAEIPLDTWMLLNAGFNDTRLYFDNGVDAMPPIDVAVPFPRDPNTRNFMMGGPVTPVNNDPTGYGKSKISLIAYRSIKLSDAANAADDAQLIAIEKSRGILFPGG
jgi:hypothetical protein